MLCQILCSCSARFCVLGFCFELEASKVEGPTREKAKGCWICVLSSTDHGPTSLGSLVDSHIVPGFSDETLIELGLDLDTCLANEHMRVFRRIQTLKRMGDKLEKVGATDYTTHMSSIYCKRKRL